MKTAVSIPDDIFHRAEELARRLGMSRSKLYAEAVSRMLREYDEEEITRRLDEVYSSLPEEEAGLDPGLEELQRRTLEMGDDAAW